jgi:hypothetical protein
MLCRKLIEAGHDPAAPLEAWRGGVLCLRVRSIGEGARLEVGANSVGFILKPVRAVRAGPPMRSDGEGAA